MTDRRRHFKEDDDDYVLGRQTAENRPSDGPPGHSGRGKDAANSDGFGAVGAIIRKFAKRLRQVDEHLEREFIEELTDPNIAAVDVQGDPN